jgi:hypothetical protein
MLARRALLACGASLLAASAARAAMPLAEGGFTRETFDLWVRLRAGEGAPVWWVSEGTVRAFPSGRLIAFMEGFDTAIAHWPDRDRPFAHQYNRKIYLFRHPETGAFLESWRGQTVEPIAYPYQFITYELVSNRVETVVEQGALPRIQRIGPARDMVVREVGGSFVFTAPVFLDITLPGGGRMEAFENYDFVAAPDRPFTQAPLSWLRTGAAPGWAGGVPCVMHLVTRRVETWEDVPEPLRARVEERYPLWRQPPADLAEVRRIQAGGVAGERWPG